MLPTKFYGIVMDVIDVPCKINLILDLMFPIPSLIDVVLTLGLAVCSDVFASFASLRENPALMNYQRNG